MNTKILASVMTVGVALMMGVAGGMAMFSDKETVGVGDINAGTLNLKVGANDPCTNHITINDIKPGWSKTWSWELKNTGSLAGELSVKFSEITNIEHGINEPEIAAGDTPGWTDGELGAHLQVSEARLGGGAKLYMSPSEKIRPSNLNELGEFTWVPKKNTIPSNWPCNEARHGLGMQYLLQSGEVETFTFALTLPENTGNIVQSDSVEFDITFHLDQ